MEITKGDILQFTVKRKYGLCQIIDTGISAHFQKEIPAYTAVIFDRIFDEKPHLDEIQSMKPYKVQWKPKDLVLYFQIAGRAPTAKYLKIGHLPINPNLELPKEDKNISIYYPIIVADWQWPIQRLSDDIEHQKISKTKVKSKYFPEWTKSTDPAIIKKCERIIDHLETSLQKAPSQKHKEEALQKAIEKMNQQEANHAFLYTIEAEQLSEKLIQLMAQNGVEKQKSEEIIDRLKSW